MGAKSVIYIDNGASFDAYEIYIDNGSSWDRYEAYVDDGSDWVLCGDKNITYLYNKGDECTSLTGGWKYKKTAVGTGMTKNDDSITIDVMGIPGGRSYALIYTINTIDLTDVSELTINSDWIVEEDNNGLRPKFAVSQTVPSSAANMDSLTNYTRGSTLDVSSLSGNYYVIVGSAMTTGNQYTMSLKVSEIGMS